MKQTNSLQKSYNPFANGRWYRIFLESNGTNITLTEQDDNISILILNNTYLLFNKTVLSMIRKPNILNSSEKNVNIGLIIRTTASTKNFITQLLNPSMFDYEEIYVFCED